jgi:hypothetical protein
MSHSIEWYMVGYYSRANAFGSNLLMAIILSLARLPLFGLMHLPFLQHRLERKGILWFKLGHTVKIGVVKVERASIYP